MAKRQKPKQDSEMTSQETYGTSSSKQTERERSSKRKDSSRRNNNYNKAEQQSHVLYQSSANFFFTEPTGGKISLESAMSKSLTPVSAQFDLNIASPGILATLISPTIGHSSDENSPINVAASALYTFIRHANSGSTNYEAPDLIMYTLAMSDVYACLMHLSRTYAIAYTFQSQNRYIPRALLLASGFNPDDVLLNLAQFRYGINVLINKAASLCVPTIVGVIRDRLSIFQNILTEGTSIKDQLYMFVPYSFYKMNFPTDPSDKGYSLKQDVFYNLNSPKTVNEALRYCNNLLDQLLGNQDFNTMSGDILKAFGKDGIFTLPPIPEIMMISPVFDIAALEMIHNSEAVGFDVFNGGNLDITQDVSANINTIVKSTAAYNVEGGIQSRFDRYFLRLKHLITTQTGYTDQSLVVDSTKFKVAVIPSDATGYGLGYLATGYQVVVANYLFTKEFSTRRYGYYFNIYGFEYSYLLSTVNYNLADTSDTNVRARMAITCVKSSFQFAPTVGVFIYDGTLTTEVEQFNSFTFMGLEGNIGDYTLIDNEELQRIHQARILIDLNSPLIAYSQTNSNKKSER